MPLAPFTAASFPMQPLDTPALLADALMLKRAALAGRAPQLLRGRNFGLVCADARSADAQRFRRAASELGARVALLGEPLDEHSTAADLRDTARMLGRLYDAVECQGLSRRLVQRIAEEAGVPVFDGASCATHASAGLADKIGHDGVSAEDNRRFVLQAVLLDAIS